MNLISGNLSNPILINGPSATGNQTGGNTIGSPLRAATPALVARGR